MRKIVWFFFFFVVAHNSFAWNTSVEEDPITDHKIITISKLAKSGVNVYGNAPALVVRCSDHSVELFVNWGVFVNNESQRVVARVDKNKPYSHRWDISTSNKATFSPTPYELFREMKPGQTLYVRTTPHGDNPITAAFSLAGFTAASAPIEKKCTAGFIKLEKRSTETKAANTELKQAYEKIESRTESQRNKIGLTTAREKKTNHRYIFIGMDMMEVQSIQGKPSKIHEHSNEIIWRYGASAVVFVDGVVTDWSNKGNNLSLEQ